MSQVVGVHAHNTAVMVVSKDTFLNGVKVMHFSLASSPASCLALRVAVLMLVC